MSGVPKIHSKGKSLGAGNKIYCENPRWDLRNTWAWLMEGKTESGNGWRVHPSRKQHAYLFRPADLWTTVLLKVQFLRNQALWKKKNIYIVSSIQIRYGETEYVIRGNSNKPVFPDDPTKLRSLWGYLYLHLHSSFIPLATKGQEAILLHSFPF